MSERIHSFSQSFGRLKFDLYLFRRCVSAFPHTLVASMGRMGWQVASYHALSADLAVCERASHDGAQGGRWFCGFTFALHFGMILFHNCWLWQQWLLVFWVHLTLQLWVTSCWLSIFFQASELEQKKGHVMTTLTIGDVSGQFYAIFGMDYLADAPHDVHHRGPLIVNSR